MFDPYSAGNRKRQRKLPGKISTVPNLIQRGQLYATLSSGELVFSQKFFLGNNKGPPIIKRNHAQLLGFVGLNDKAESMPDTLSGGEKQRVAIARALAMHPEMLLLDEPTSALDLELVQEVLKVIRSLANQETTMIIVTHQLKFAMEIADKIVFMEKGRIVEEGSPCDIMINPKEARTREFIQSVSNSEGDLSFCQTGFYQDQRYGRYGKT